MSLSHGGVLSERIIKMAIDGHRQLGPGLLESAYEECLSGLKTGLLMNFISVVLEDGLCRFVL